MGRNIRVEFMGGGPHSVYLLDGLRAAGVPARAFDHDHYDVPERLFRELTARRALAVSGTQLVRRLLDSGRAGYDSFA